MLFLAYNQDKPDQKPRLHVAPTQCQLAASVWVLFGQVWRIHSISTHPLKCYDIPRQEKTTDAFRQSGFIYRSNMAALRLVSHVLKHIRGRPSGKIISIVQQF